MSRLILRGASVAVAAAVVATSAPLAQAATVSTPYGSSGSGYGLHVAAGVLPLASGDLAKVNSGCTNKAGINVKNSVASTVLPGNLGTIGAMSTRSWTSKSGSTVNRYTRTNIASVNITSPATHLSLLKIEGITSIAHVWHNSSGFHYGTSVSAVSVKGPGGLTTLPTPTKPITIPGVVTLSMNSMNRAKDANHAFARMNGLTLQLLPGSAKETDLILAQSRAEIQNGVRTGVFQGNGYATQASVLGGTLTSNGQPEVYMPCIGTGGKVETRSLANAPLNNLGLPLSTSDATSAQMGAQYTKNGTKVARGFERSWIADVNLANGALAIRGLQAQANVTRSGRYLNTVSANSNGTKTASITINGTPVSGLDALNGKTISLPAGLATIRTGVRQKLYSGESLVGMKVTALQISLLDSSSSTKTVVNLGNAQLRIFRP